MSEEKKEPVEAATPTGDDEYDLKNPFSFFEKQLGLVYKLSAKTDKPHELAALTSAAAELVNAYWN